MSFILGCLKQSGQNVEEIELRALSASTKQYSMGTESLEIRGRLGMGVLPYYSHARSRLDPHPCSDAHGHSICLDGRLDNHAELARELDLPSGSTSDSAIALAAFARWGASCFEYLLGDWAIALWSQRDETLYLARDHAGSRTLYFQNDVDGIAWSTHLDTFPSTKGTLDISREYAARYLAGRPVQPLTPYAGIFAVKPGHCMTFRNATVSETSHWSIYEGSEICFKSDREYEDQFLDLFQQSIARRTGAGEPILAELSGGMDSSSIVCVSDSFRRMGCSESALLDTVSYFDDSESSLNDRPYFTQVETSRGKTGYHVDTAFAKRTFEPHDSSMGIYRIPGADSSSFELESTFHDAVWSRGYRSILSGIGGDELTGGVPSALPELAGYVMAGDLRKLLRQSLAWAIADRSTLGIILWQTASYLYRLYGNRIGNSRGVPPWVSSDFTREFKGTWTDSLLRHHRFSLAPHQVDNIQSWQSIMETLPHQFPGLLFRPEYRYPFLDKDLVHFLWNIPRDQLLRPGRRRSLMRRALVGIVPHDVLERRLKAFQLSAPLKKVAETESLLCALFRDSILARHGYIDPSSLVTWIQRTAAGDPTWWQALLKTISLELWFRGHENQKPDLAEDWALTTALEFGRTKTADKIRRLQHSS